MPHTNDWQIRGADSQTIFGTVYQPEGPAVGCAVVAHGFKGYKDFRMIPVFAAGLCRAGLVVHAFNFSHSGMTANPERFERPDLFELDTWNKQVVDIECIVEAISVGELPGRGLPYLLVGHSRGGGSVILFAGRHAADSQLPKPSGVITVASPDQTCDLPETVKSELRERGFIESPSARTGQVLRVGSQWLIDQESDPAAHNLLDHVRKIRCPMLVIHGENDETVDVDCSSAIANAAENAQVVRIRNCNHVFNAPNPPPPDAHEIPELKAALGAMVPFALECCR